MNVRQRSFFNKNAYLIGMIETVRASIRLVLFFILSLMTILFVAWGNLLLGFFSEQWTIRWKNFMIKNWARLTAAVIGLKMDIKGTSPKPPFFLVSNHLSYIDVVPLWRYLDATFVAKSEIKSWPFFGWGTRTLGVLFIDRELRRDVRRMNNRMEDTISDTQGVILFPEGTSTHGEKVLPFNAPLLEFPATNAIPVNHASISYRSGDPSRPAHSNICWWGDMKFFPHFWELLKISQFEATITFGNSKITDTDRKELARKLQQAVSQNFIPVAGSDHKFSKTNKEI